jgi:hypothetical protein
MDVRKQNAPNAGQWGSHNTTSKERGTHELADHHDLHRRRPGTDKTIWRNRAHVLAHARLTAKRNGYGSLWGSAVRDCLSGVGDLSGWHCATPLHGEQHHPDRRIVSLICAATCAWSERESMFNLIMLRGLIGYEIELTKGKNGRNSNLNICVFGYRCSVTRRIREVSGVGLCRAKWCRSTSESGVSCRADKNTRSAAWSAGGSDGRPGKRHSDAKDALDNLCTLPCYGLGCWLESGAVNQGCSLCINCLKSATAFWVPTLLAKLFRTNPPEWCFTCSSILAKTRLSKSCKAIACQTARSFIARSALRRFCLSRQAIGLIGFNSGSLICYSFRSWLNSIGVGLGHFWPVFVPISRSQIHNRDLTICDFTNVFTAGSWYFSLTSSPLVNCR